MRFYLKRILIFIFIPFLALLVFIFLELKYIPAPKITISYSLNEKLFKFDKYDCDYMCIGSSMALNNVNSEEVINYYDSKKYFNFASWGVRMTDLYSFFKIYLSKFHPKSIIIVSNAMDFVPKDNNFMNSEVKWRILYPYDILTPLYYVSHLDFHYYYKHYKLGRLYYNCDTINSSLKFDKYGWVKLVTHEIPPADLLDWNSKIEFKDIDDENYNYLDSISRLLVNNSIKLVFVQTPLREGLIDSEYRVEIKKHVRKVDDIIKKYDQTFIDATQITWPDSLFFDYAHFNSQGAKIFTRYFLNKIDESDQLSDVETKGKRSVKPYQETD